jgi:hypothetical protein
MEKEERTEIDILDFVMLCAQIHIRNFETNESVNRRYLDLTRLH